MPILAVCILKFWVQYPHTRIALAYCSPDLGLRMAQHISQLSIPLIDILQGMMDGWAMGQDDGSLFWVPAEHKRHLCVPPPRVVIEASQISTILDLSNNSRFGKEWMECIHKEWLRELEKKEELGNLFE